MVIVFSLCHFDIIKIYRLLRTGRGMKKTLSQGKRLVNGGGSERTPLLTDRDSQIASGGVIMLKVVKNSQIQESVSVTSSTYDDTDSYGGESIHENGYNTFTSKPTTSSMINYTDFRSDSASQQEDVQSQTRSLSLEGYDISMLETDKNVRSAHKKGAHLQVKVVAEINTDNSSKSVSTDETFKHLDVIQDSSDSKSIHSHSISVVPEKHSETDSSESLPHERSAQMDHLKDENITFGRSTEEKQSGSTV